MCINSFSISISLKSIKISLWSCLFQIPISLCSFFNFNLFFLNFLNLSLNLILMNSMQSLMNWYLPCNILILFTLNYLGRLFIHCRISGIYRFLILSHFGFSLFCFLFFILFLKHWKWVMYLTCSISCSVLLRIRGVGK